MEGELNISCCWYEKIQSNSDGGAISLVAKIIFASIAKTRIISCVSNSRGGAAFIENVNQIKVSCCDFSLNKALDNPAFLYIMETNNVDEEIKSYFNSSSIVSNELLSYSEEEIENGKTLGFYSCLIYLSSNNSSRNIGNHIISISFYYCVNSACDYINIESNEARMNGVMIQTQSCDNNPKINYINVVNNKNGESEFGIIRTFDCDMIFQQSYIAYNIGKNLFHATNGTINVIKCFINHENLVSSSLIIISQTLLQMNSIQINTKDCIIKSTCKIETKITLLQIITKQFILIFCLNQFALKNKIK